MNFSIFFTSCTYFVLYWRHVWLSVMRIRRFSLRYFKQSRQASGSFKYSRSACLANSSHEWINIWSYIYRIYMYYHERTKQSKATRESCFWRTKKQKRDNNMIALFRVKTKRNSTHTHTCTHKKTIYWQLANEECTLIIMHEEEISQYSDI